MAVLGKSINKIREDGFRRFFGAAASYTKNNVEQSLMTYLNTKVTIGTNVFEKNWDVLILLDTCRIDALKELSDEFHWLEVKSSIQSVGGSSPEWITKTFSDGYSSSVRKTAYLTTNPYAKQILDDETPHERLSGDTHFTYKLLANIDTVCLNDFGRYEPLYEYESRGEEGPLGHKDGHTPPRYVTDRAISVSRNFEFDRLILHYWQPHYPYFAKALSKNRDLERYEGTVEEWAGYIRDTGNRQKVWESYMNELRYVLNDVELLLENIEAERVIISSDHGESFGEYGVYGHKIGSMHPHIRNVPWAITSAEDKQTYVSENNPPNTSNESSSMSTDEQLRALGYT